ncbi:Proteasome subunit beta type-3 [Saguinus oedipus]|uniref:Proteasome subunit beta type-3 n=1 Tax=Saguinus oedipus TaxID=9490 RepID=A0ABQ9VGN2_SAGOE|nr:Proteasome subunit beta type-3 [Saguinus oedipus]
MAMKGKDCVAIAADKHFRIQAWMVTTDFQIFPIGDRLYIGLAGLATDVQIVAQCLNLVANLLYEKRLGPYYTEPVIAGLDPKTWKPFSCSLDLISCPMVTDDFVDPNIDPEHLFESISHAMLNAVDCDAVSGMGVIVHITEKDKITTRTLKAQMD